MSGNKEVETWFDNHKPPFTKDIVQNLNDFGVGTVEDLKLYTARDVAELFSKEKTIVKRKAEIAWRHLGSEQDFEFKKKPPVVTIETPTTPHPIHRSTNTEAGSKSHKMQPNVGEGYSEGYSLNHFGFTCVVIDRKEDIKRAKEERSDAKEVASKGTVINIDDIEQTPFIQDKTR